jgi:hypothetical protein
MTESVRDTPQPSERHKTIATRSLVYAGIICLAVSAFCVLATVAGMVWTFEQLPRSANVPHPQDVASGISRASIPMIFAAPAALVGLVLIVVGVVRRKRIPGLPH